MAGLLKFFVFFAFAFLGYFVFVLIRVASTNLIRMEAVLLLNRWGGVILAGLRWCLLTSLLFFSITVSDIGYLKDSLSGSFTSPKLFKLTPKVYTSLWNGLMSRFMDKKAFNEAVLQVGQNSSK